MAETHAHTGIREEAEDRGPGLTAPMARGFCRQGGRGWGEYSERKSKKGVRCRGAQRGSSGVSEPNLSGTPVDKAKRGRSTGDPSYGIRTTSALRISAWVAQTGG